MNLRSLAFAALLCLPMGAVYADTTYLTDVTVLTTVDDNINVGDSSNSPTVSIGAGGIVTGVVKAYNNSVVKLDGGTIYDHLSADDHSTGNIYAGSTISGLIAYDQGTVNVRGGSVTVGALANDTSTVNIYGGSIGNNLYAYDSGTINLYGTDLAATPLSQKQYFPNKGMPVDYGVLDEYALSGHLLDSTEISTILYIQRGTGAAYHLVNDPAPVPEPAFVQLGALLGCSGLVLIKRRQR